MDVICLIYSEEQVFHKLRPLILDIRRLLLKPWEVQMHHTLKEANS
jgi:hypothetical protein